MARYLCDDGNCEVEIEADSPEEAAQKYVDEGSWGNSLTTSWVQVGVMPVDGDPDTDWEWHLSQIDPKEPPCIEGEDHEWSSPHELVGGLVENPGVFAHGGGVFYHEVCTHCGCLKTTDTWAQDPETGTQGLRSVTYEPDAYPVADLGCYIPEDMGSLIDEVDGDLSYFVDKVCQKALQAGEVLHPSVVISHLKEMVDEYLSDHPDGNIPFHTL